MNARLILAIGLTTLLPAVLHAQPINPNMQPQTSEYEQPYAAPDAPPSRPAYPTYSAPQPVPNQPYAPAAPAAANPEGDLSVIQSPAPGSAPATGDLSTIQAPAPGVAPANGDLSVIQAPAPGSPPPSGDLSTIEGPEQGTPPGEEMPVEEVSPPPAISTETVPVAPAPVADPAAEGAVPATNPDGAPVEEADPVAEEYEQKTFTSVVLQGLNKVTARVEEIDASLGTVAKFGKLEILAISCWQSPPDEKPENAALLEVWEQKSNEPAARIFSGWMFSSSPGLSALEHPVYDITVIRCESAGNAGVSAE